MELGTAELPEYCPMVVRHKNLLKSHENPILGSGSSFIFVGQRSHCDRTTAGPAKAARTISSNYAAFCFVVHR
jgi:hypothetical protein